MAKKKEEDETLRLSFELVKSRLAKKNDSLICTADKVPNIKRMPTGLKVLDNILEGGLPVGRLTQIAGPDKAGKTTLTYQVIATAQRLHPKEKVIYIDAEGTFDPERAVIYGVDLSRLEIVWPENAEEAFKTITEFLKTTCPLIVLDSVPMCFPEKVMVNDVGEVEVAPIARFLTIELPKLLPDLKRSLAVLLFVNQIREKVGGMGGWGDNTQLPGGRQLRHFSSLILKAQRRSGIKKSDEEVGQEIKVRVDASKVCKPKGECLLNLIYPYGFIEDSDLEQAKTEARKLSLAKARENGVEQVISDEE